MNGQDSTTQDSSLQSRAGEIAAPVDRRRWPIFVAAAALAAAALTAGVWYALQPHSAADQFARAEKLERQLLAEGPRMAADKREALRDKTLEAYQKVFTRFDPVGDEAPRAQQRLAEMQALAGHDDAARQWYRRLIDDYPRSSQAKAAYATLAESLRRGGKAQLAKNQPVGMKMLEEAAETLAAYVERYGPADEQADDAAMERCRIFHDDIVDPPIQAIQALQDFVKAFGPSAGSTQPPPQTADPVIEEQSARNRPTFWLAAPPANVPGGQGSPLVDEALWRLGRLYEQIGEHAAAADYFKRVADGYPDSKYLKDSEIGYARNLEKYRPEQAEQVWKDLAEKYPDEAQVRDRVQQFADREVARKADEARREERQYRQDRYGAGGGGGGGGGHLDTGWGKPIPPTEMLRDFIEQKVNAVRYDLKVALDPAKHGMTVTGSVELINEGRDKTDFLLMLGPLFAPGVFTLDGQAVEVDRPAGKDDVIHLKLAQAWTSGQTATLTFDYQATVSPLPAVPDALRAKMIEQLGRAPWRGRWPMLAEPASAPAAEQEEADAPFNPASYMGHPGLQLQVNESGYALCGAAWYPVTIFGDLFTADLEFEVAGEQVLVSSGRQIDLPAEQASADGVRRTKWRCEQELFGLYFAFGPYKVVTRTFQGLELSGCFLEGQADKIEPYLDEAEKILTFYIERFGPFPFEKMALLEVELPPILGGVGPAGLVFLHSFAVGQSADVLSALLAHELSHQWWGNQVPINLIDPKYSQWLSEGFATYSDALYTETSRGEQAFREHIRKIQKMYLDESAAMREEPIIETFMGQSPLYRVVVYEKGALVLHALRFVLGDETFFGLLKEYAARFAFKPSTVDDFRKLAVEVSGQELDWFFDEWLDQPGCPRFAIQSVTPAPAGPSAEGEAAANGRVRIAVRQPDRLSRMPLEIRVEGPDGASTTVRRELGKKENELTVEVDFPANKVRRVELDPDDWVLRRVTTQGGTAEDVWDADAADF